MCILDFYPVSAFTFQTFVKAETSSVLKKTTIFNGLYLNCLSSCIIN